MQPETIETLRQAQRFGFLGSRPVELAAEHSMAFVSALEGLPTAARIIDIGSGGGLPGLVMADARSDWEIQFVERRQTRADFLARAVSRLGFTHVTVRWADVERIADAIAAGSEQAFDALTARGFGPPETTLRLARRLITSAGTIVISEPPEGNRWSSALLNELGLVGERLGAVRRFSFG